MKPDRTANALRKSCDGSAWDSWRSASQECICCARLRQLIFRRCDLRHVFWRSREIASCCRKELSMGRRKFSREFKVSAVDLVQQPGFSGASR